MNGPYQPVVQFRRTLRACTGQSLPILFHDVCRDGHHGRFSSCRLLRQRLLRSSLAPSTDKFVVGQERDATSSVHALRALTARQKIPVRHPDDHRDDRHHGILVDEPH